MKKNVYNKMVVIGIVISFLSLIVAPSINANISDNISNGVIKDNNDESDFNLLIICPRKFSLALKPLVRHKNKFDVSDLKPE